jgi:hypothetical protein
VWTLTSHHYLGFLSTNVHKFLGAFEWIQSLGVEGKVKYKHYKVLAMLLQALPFTFDSGPIQAGSKI